MLGWAATFGRISGSIVFELPIHDKGVMVVYSTKSHNETQYTELFPRRFINEIAV